MCLIDVVRCVVLGFLHGFARMVGLVWLVFGFVCWVLWLRCWWVALAGCVFGCEVGGLGVCLCFRCGWLFSAAGCLFEFSLWVFCCLISVAWLGLYLLCYLFTLR